MRAASLVLFAALGACSVAATASVGTGGDPTTDPAVMQQLATLSPDTLPKPPPDVSNRYADDPRAARLGQKLFFDPSFSGRLLDSDNDGSPSTLGKTGDTGKVACAGCHLPTSGFLDSRSFGKQISLASGWGLRKAPSLLDVGQDRLVTWDGRRDALYNQIFGPIESPVEMNSSRLYVAEQLAKTYRAEYEAVFGPMPPFDDATKFPPIAANVTGCQPLHGTPEAHCDGTMHGMPGDKGPYDGLSAADQDAVTRAVVNMGKAIGAYERTLTCGTSRFDAWIHGDATALTDSERRGAGLFAGKGECITCHSGPFFSDQKFHNVGLGPKPVGVVFADLGDRGASDALVAANADPLNTHGAFSDGDDGRLPTTVPPEAAGAFKTPMLRCIDRRPSFMHTAQIRTLAEVVAFFDRAGDGPGVYGTNELHVLGLSDAEQQDLVAFMEALAGPGPDPSLLQSP